MAGDTLINASLQSLSILECDSPYIKMEFLIQDEMGVYLIGTNVSSGHITVITVKPKNGANFR